MIMEGVVKFTLPNHVAYYDWEIGYQGIVFDRIAVMNNPIPVSQELFDKLKGMSNGSSI